MSCLSGLRGRLFPLIGTLFSSPDSSLPIFPLLTLAQAQGTLLLLADATHVLSQGLCPGCSLCLEYCSLPVLAISSLEVYSMLTFPMRPLYFILQPGPPYFVTFPLFSHNAYDLITCYIRYANIYQVYFKISFSLC